MESVYKMRKSRAKEILIEYIENENKFSMMNNEELARHFNYDPSALLKCFKRHGIEITNGRKENEVLRIAKKRKMEICAMVDDGLSYDEIMLNTDLTSKNSLSSIVRQQGLCANKPKPFEFSDFEYSVIIGTLLGDGAIGYSYANEYGNCRLSLQHSIRQREYMLYKISSLQKYFNNKPVKIRSKTGLHFKDRDCSKFADKEYFSVSKHSISNSSFTELRQKWYGEDGKQVPSDLILTPAMVAFWYQDDGTSQTYNMTFCTDSFDEKSCNILIEALGQLKIKCRLLKHHRIGINAESFIPFCLMIKPYVHDTMMYKLNKVKKWLDYCELTGTSC